MTLDQQLRDRLRRDTEHVPGGPDLDAAIAAGRAGRRRRHLAATGGGLAAAAVVATVTVVALGGGTADTPVADDAERSAGFADAPPDGDAGTDFIAGTDRDEVMAAAIARDLPSLPQPDDVYPSDWDHAGPTADARFAEATDFQATYSLGGAPGSDVLVLAGWARPSEPPLAGCTPVRHDPDQPPCADEEVAGGTVVSDSYTTGNGAYVFYSAWQGADGFGTTLMETVTAGSWADAAGQRRLDGVDPVPLLTEDDLRFPLPAGRG